MTGAEDPSPHPWRKEPIPGGWVVVDAVNTALCYVYPAESGAQECKPHLMGVGKARSVADAIVAEPLRDDAHTAQKWIGTGLRVEELDGCFALSAPRGC